MNKLNVPQLRFPGFEGEWEEKKLDEMAQFKAGYAFKSEHMLSKKSNYQILKMSNVYQNELRLDRNPSFWKTIDTKQKEFLLKKGDSILTLTGTVGKKDYGYSIKIEEDNKYLLNQRLVLLREKQSKSDNNFISYLISNERFLFYFFAEAKGGTGNQTNVSIEDVRNISLNFPTLPEQQKIASFLSAVDEKIQQLSRKKELLEQYKKGVMQQLFSGKLRFKDENGKDYPDWEEKKLGDVLKIGSGKDYKHLDEGNIPVFGTGGYMLSVNKFLHSGETVFIGRKGTIDKPFYFKGDFWTVDTLFYTHTFKNTIPKFIYCVFQQINWKLHNEASGVPSLSKSTIEKLKFAFPCVPEQQKIANYLSSIDAKIENTNSELEKTQLFKKGLLQKMFV